jgi:acetyl-CoA carboxylase biotin carboxyl carrier protein
MVMSDSKTKPVDVFDLERIRSLIELMKEHDLSELDLRQSEQQIRLARGGTATAPTVSAAPLPVTALPRESQGTADEAEKNIAYIKSPMVGTFYSRANPNAAPFVKIGDLVGESTTVCIIEAMKVFNEIPAEITGRILAVLAADEEPVDFGKPLFKLDTSQ